MKIPKVQPIRSQFLITVFFCLAAVASATESHNILVCYPGGPGTTEQAQPVMKSFSHYLESSMNWDTNSAYCEYHNDTGAALEFLQNRKPTFGIVSLPFFLKQRTTHPMKPLLSAEMENADKQYYYILAQKSTYKDLEDLKGKKLTGNHLDDLNFLGEIIFDGAVDPKADFELIPQKSFRAIKDVAKGEADAVILDFLQYNSLKELDMSKQFEVVFRSKELQPPVVVTFTEHSESDTLESAFVETLSKMNKSGSEVLKEMQMKRFLKADLKAYQKLIEKYGK